jgi:hypothetical protein
MEFCSVSYAKGFGSDSVDQYRGAVYVDRYNTLRISNSAFYNNYAPIQGGAIGLNHSDIIINDCVFKNNLTNPQMTGHGAALCATDSKFVMRHCMILNNKSNSAGGAILATRCNETIFQDNIFEGNIGSSGGAVFVLDSDRLWFINNLFFKNTSRFFGGSIVVRQSEVNFLNCTIVHNYSQQSGGGIYLSNNAMANFFNTIIYDNLAASLGMNIHIAYINSTCNFHFCAVQGNSDDFGGAGGGVNFWGKMNHVIDDYPVFVDSETQNYRLSDNSPYIEKGDTTLAEEWMPKYDLDGNKRIVNQNIDIGCYENQTLISAIGDIRQLYDARIFSCEGQLCFESEYRIRKVSVFNLNGKLLCEYRPDINKGTIPLSYSGKISHIIVVYVVFDNNQRITKKVAIQ